MTVSRAFAKGRLKDYTKTARSRRRVPLRAVVLEALSGMSRGRGVLFPTAKGGRIEIHNWRSRHWVPALQASGVAHQDL